MKKSLIIVLLALLGMTQLSAQEGEYIPFVREGVKWVCYFDSEYCHAYEVDWSRFYPLGKTYFTLEIKGDTVINGKAYKKMHKYSGDAINAQCDTVPVCLREEGKIVYGIIPNPEEYYGLFIGYGMWFYKRPDINIVDAARSGEEFILYDFSNPENYYNTIYHLRNGDGSLSNQSSEFNYEGCDEVSIGDRMARCYRFKYLGFFDVFFIEGIGYDSNIYGYTLGYLYVSRNQLMHPWCQGLFLNHVEENGKIIYKGINYEQVMPADGHMPMAQEGKIWVNERVIINKGDTTRSYYCYEVKGNDPRFPSYDVKQCHYYTGAKIDPENDSIVSSLADPLLTSEVESLYNWPLQENIEKNRSMLRHEELTNGYLLYWLQHGEPERTIRFYVARQNSPMVLTVDNFIAVEPIEIDGFTCERYAYVNEQDEPQAYLVEGIGFDSRCMGDLLTPFTREPDHDADYQEYCGLSHVIKDGKIIYKGLCYDERRVQLLTADVNGDGVVNISDVTALIDMLLKERPSLQSSGDIDQSGQVNITDVVRLIDLIMSE